MGIDTTIDDALSKESIDKAKGLGVTQDGEMFHYEPPKGNLEGGKQFEPDKTKTIKCDIFGLKRDNVEVLEKMIGRKDGEVVMLKQSVNMKGEGVSNLSLSGTDIEMVGMEVESKNRKQFINDSIRKRGAVGVVCMSEDEQAQLAEEVPLEIIGKKVIVIKAFKEKGDETDEQLQEKIRLGIRRVNEKTRPEAKSARAVPKAFNARRPERGQ